MEFLSAKQKKDKARRLFVGYGLFGILILLATYVMVSTALGYEVFSTKGEIVQNGLLFIDSRPDAASITINGKLESERTNAKLSLPEGTYEILLQKPGYKDWKHTISLSGGSVEFLTYPRLLPDTPTEVSSTSYAGTSLTNLQSRDKRWVLLHSTAEPNIIRMHDMERPTADVVSFTMSSLDPADPVTGVELVEWAGDNSHFIVKQNYAGRSEHVVLSREKIDERLVVETTFGLGSLSKVSFWDGKWDILSVLDSAGTVRLARTKEKAVDAVSLVAGVVKDFYPLSSARAVFTTAADNGAKSLYMLDDTKAYLITTLPSSTEPLYVKGGGFNRNDYLLVSGAGLEKALLYRNIIDQVKQSSTLRATPFVTMPITGKTAEFSRSNRFVLVSSDTEHAVYDIEQKELSRYKPIVDQIVSVGWFDDARLYAIKSDKTLFVYDFNGSNTYQLSSGVSSAPIVDASVETTGVLTELSGVSQFRVLDIARSETE